MRNLEKYKGVIPAFYACYDKEGNISPEGVQGLTKYFVKKGVKGVYVKRFFRRNVFIRVWRTVRLYLRML